MAKTTASSPFAHDGAALLQRLAAFRIDDVKRPAWSFAQRLAHDNRWKRSYADAVVVEYKRFLALTVLAGHGVCPSEQVDQAWHLHLLYTRSYWKRLCGEVLNKELHHAPTQGGAVENDKHELLYLRTLASYQRIFGEVPPPGIWPPPAQRFGKDVQAARVSTVDNLIVNKRWLVQVTVVAAVILAAAVAGAGTVG